MKILLTVVALLALLPDKGVAAQKPPVAAATADRLGLACAQILQMSSTEWVTKFTNEKGGTPDATVRATTAYGKCYDSRTSHLASVLSEKRKGPSPSARKDFTGFEQALKDFTATALAATNPPADSVKTAYAVLYEKRFRRDLYVGYEQKASKPAVRKGAPAASAAQPPAAPEGSQTEAPPDKNDPMTKAKNRFGELLGVLPEDKIHVVHGAFGKIFASTPVSGETKFEIYRYAIFVLEPPSAQPFSPPLF